MTTKQMYAREKTHTIRDGWWDLKPGDVLMAVEKCQGLKKGEKIVPICPIRIVKTRRSNLYHVSKALCVREGFPNLSPVGFAEMLMQHSPKIRLTTPLNFIRFEYV